MLVRSPGQRVHGLDLDARVVERHDEGRQAGVLRCAGIGAGEEEDVVAEVGIGREHLLPVDDPPVTVAPLPCLHSRDVRPGLRLGHAQRDHGLAPQDLRSTSALSSSERRPDH
jgi:hypothetical protein